MRILFVATKTDPFNLNTGSGSDYQFYQAFKKMGAEIKVIGPFHDSPSLIERTYRKILCSVTTRRVAKFSMQLLRESASEVQRAVADFQPDLIFSRNLAGLVRCRTHVPIVYRFDTTLIGIKEQWNIFSDIEINRMIAWEKNVLKKTALAITHSTWSENILINSYHFPKDKILVFPNPASLPEPFYSEPVTIPERIGVPIHLLLVGKNGRRKGLDIAIRTTELLNQSGIPTELHIVGLLGENTPTIKYYGYYDKTIPEQLQNYLDHYRWAHLLIHPARFEAAGIVPSEAAIFGVPTITNAVGGLATTVAHNISGIVLSKDSPAELYATTIKELYKNPIAYHRLCQTTRQRYIHELNWRVNQDILQKALENMLEHKK